MMSSPASLASVVVSIPAAAGHRSVVASDEVKIEQVVPLPVSPDYVRRTSLEGIGSSVTTHTTGHGTASSVQIHQYTHTHSVGFEGASASAPTLHSGHRGSSTATTATATATATAAATDAKDLNAATQLDAISDQMLIQASQHEWQWSLSRVHTTVNGVVEAERGKRLIEYGPNRLVTQVTPPWYIFLWRAFLHPFNILLLCLSAGAGATEDWRTMTVLILMVLLSVLLRFDQEMKAAISAESLRARVRQMVRVRRPITQADRDATRTDSLVTPHSTAAQPHVDYVIEEVNYESIVPGDVVELQAGSIVPGDVRVMVATHLMINQSMLTGESMPVEKKSTAAPPITTAPRSKASPPTSVTTAPESSAAPSSAPAVVLVVKDAAHSEPSDDQSADFLRRSNLAFMGSIVESGSGIGIVMVTGVRSFLGRNARSLLHERPQTAFAIGVKRVAFLLMSFMAVMVPLVIVISGLVQGDWLNAALFGLSVAVGLTPEMLPMIVNTNLSLGAHVMAKEKAVVKRLEAIQNIGAATVLCTDKTGTLTDDHVAVHSALDAVGAPCDRTFEVAHTIAALQTGFRNVLDAAIVDAGKVRGVTLGCGGSAVSLVSELPFDFKRRRMSVCVQIAGQADLLLMSKGSAEELLAACTYELRRDVEDTTAVASLDSQTGSDGDEARDRVKSTSPSGATGFVTRPLTAERMHELHALINKLASDGLRVLAIAQRIIPVAHADSMTSSSETKMSLVGFVTFLDPPKKDAKDTLVKIAQLGVAVKVLTGDHVLVAKKVCGELGLDVADKTMTGEDMLELGVDDQDPKVRACIERTVLFARLNPAQKAFVVSVLREMNHTVAFLGDGVNDALALREADVGISVDSATNLAKDAADMILTEKSLDVLRAAVVTGRRTHGNTIKYIKMTASSNFGNVCSMLIASCWLPFLPMLPIHILAQNMIYDISQTAIPWDNIDEEYLRTPKPWSAKSLGWFMVIMGPTSSIFDVTTFLFNWFVLGFNANANAEQITEFQTGWFMLGLLTQTMIVHMIRTEKIPFFQSIASRSMLTMTVVLSGFGLMIACTPPVAQFFSMKRPPDIFFPYLFAAIFCYMILSQFVKGLYIRFRHEWL